MRHWSLLPLALLACVLDVEANEILLDQQDSNDVGCQGMYSRKAWGGNVDPFIEVKFLQPDDAGDADATVGLLIYEWKDESQIGKAASPDRPDVLTYFCNDDAIKQGVCSDTEKYSYILATNATDRIFTQAIHLNNSEPIHYAVTKTGWYCVGTNADEGVKYKAAVEFRNAFGELPAAQIAKLPFYGGIALVYAVVGIFWAMLYFQHRSDILAVQNYITAIIGYLIVEMILTWGYFDYQNSHGINLGARAFMIVVAILNAGRNSFSFFLLLIVCMGYGVVKTSLGKTMIYIRWLAAGHFVFGVVYAIASLTIQPDDAGPLVLLIILPLSATLTAFYVWTLNSLNMTMKDLVTRKQHVKALMYRRLWWCILSSILVIFVFFFFNSLSFAGVGSEDFAPTHWMTRWFVLDGWLNIVYFADVCFIAYLWRPTANNRRFAMSDEIAQDDDGFEIASLRDSMDDEEEGYGGIPAANDNNAELPPYQSMSVEGQGPPVPPKPPLSRQDSPLPAPKPQKPSSLPRQSLDGDTLFHVGDEDRWSDDDDADPAPTGEDREQNKRLTGKSD